MKKIIALILSLALVGCTTTKPQTKELKEVQFILDWTPNTNHTGLFVAQEKGYLKEIGVDLKIQQPPEGSTTELIANGKAPFGISFQDSLAKKFEKKIPVTAVAAVIEHNTSGIVSLKDKNILSPKDLVNVRYGTWDDPIELKVIETVMKNENANFSDVKLVPNNADNSITGLSNNLFDSAWIFYAWDGVLADHNKLATNFFYFKDFARELDFYTPVIIANNDYLKNNSEEATKIMTAIKKGYQFAMDHPKEAAQILIKYAPELKAQEKFVEESQIWISKQYASNKENWGKFDANRWNAFYQWINDNKLVDTALPLNYGFTNDYVGK